MTIEELKEVYERYQAGSRGGFYTLHDLRVDACVIADALLDPTPIDRGVLTELGGTVTSPDGNPNLEVLFYVGQSLLFVAHWAVRDRWEFHLRERPGDFAQTLFPQPKTKGQLIGLLIALEGK